MWRCLWGAMEYDPCTSLFVLVPALYDNSSRKAYCLTTCKPDFESYMHISIIGVFLNFIFLLLMICSIPGN